MNGICKVCELLDNDKTEKEVEWCEVCNEHICKECEPNLFKRGQAMIIDKKNKAIKWLKEI